MASLHGGGGRHGLVCPNSPYREYVRAWVEEECRPVRPRRVPVRHDLLAGRLLLRRTARSGSPTRSAARSRPRLTGSTSDGWPSSIAARPGWRSSPRSPPAPCETLRPGASVEHQASTYPLHWQFGVNAPLIPQNDFLQGDFYGDSWQGSFVRKLLEDLTPHRPFGFETSFSAELADHTAMKSEALLEAKASAAVADNAAFIFIDAIDPIGTLNPRVYDRMGRIFDRLMPYYDELGGQASRRRRRVLQPRLQVRLRRQRPAGPRRRHDRRPYQERHFGHPRTGQPSYPFGFVTKTHVGALE